MAQSPLTPELAREWARKRWSKPNAKQREAALRMQRRLALAEREGETAMLAVALGETYRLAGRVLGRQRLLDERPLPERTDTTPSGGLKVGGSAALGATKHPRAVHIPGLG
jgi:hypothetical protein